MTTTNFLGMRIDGDIVSARSRINQKDPALLQPAFAAVLAHPDFVGARWRQYTPYFNDGDTCEFSVGEMTFRLKGLPDDCGDYSDGFIDLPNTYETDPAVVAVVGKVTRKWDHENRLWHVTEVIPGSVDAALIEACEELAREIGSGAYDDGLLQAFGDHATVTLNGETKGFSVEFYEHD